MRLSGNKAEVTTLKPGADVFTHSDTLKILANSAIPQSINTPDRDRVLINGLRGIQESTKESGRNITKALKKSGGRLVKDGSLIYRKIEDDNGNTKLHRAKIFGS